MPCIETLVSRAKRLIDLTVEQYERWPSNPSHHSGVVYGIWNMFFALCLNLPEIPWDVIDEMDRYTKEAVAWVYQRHKVRRYLKAA